MIYQGSRWSFAKAGERINRLTQALIQLGVKKGDRVAVLQVNCNQYIEAYFAAAKIGAIFVPLNFRAKSDELGYMIAHAEAKILFVGDRYFDLVQEMLPDLSSIEQCILIDSEQGGKLSYEKLIRTSSPEEFYCELDGEDVTMLMYTAGTTGRPKGVPLKHTGFVSYILDNVNPASPDIEERNLLTVPLYHIAGMQAVLAAVYGGRTLVLMSQFEVKEWLKTVQQEQVNRAMVVPTMLKWIIDDPDFDAYDLSSLKVISYGAAPMPFEIIDHAIKKMPSVQFINAFGQTETASTITALGPEDHIIEGTEQEREKKIKRLSASIGKPLPDVEVKIVDENGKTLPTSVVGEILVKGARVMTGYWRDEQKTSQVLNDDGWLCTGDQGWMDADGYIFLAGRADDMIIRGGENISPKEIEDVLDSHPMVEESSVIGVPDPEWGQQPRAIVVLNKDVEATPEEIVEYCRSRLAGFKRPRSIVFVDSIPRNPMGKVLKRSLREQYGQP
jgi:acyl-CoA synthetase (AMP-forming)/AMP-acid ligase II